MDEALRHSTVIENRDGQVVSLNDDHEMLVVGYSNKTLSLLKTRKASKSLAIYLARPLSLLKIGSEP